MKFAPIIIPTLCRYEHFVRMIESLKKNTLAKFTDVYVSLDCPISEKHREGYLQICEYLKGDFSEFRSLTVICQRQNLGGLRNNDFLINYILGKYDRFIRTDDDAEFSPNFLEYMNKCLEEYEEDPNVIAVTGYSYPIKWKVSEDATIFKENFLCPMWGTGFWRDKYQNIYKYIDVEGGLAKDARTTIKNGGIAKMTHICQKEFAELCLSPDFSKTLAARVTDISLRMYMAAKNKFVIMPTISKVRNWGFDGTGEYCGISKDGGNQENAKDYSYHLQQIDVEENFVLKEDFLHDIYVNRKRMNDFDTLPMIHQIKMYIKLLMYYMLGANVFNRIIMLYRKLK